jgi:hydrogenase-4 component H
VILSKIKEAMLALRAGRVTKRYPFLPAPAPEALRGWLSIDEDKCIGCAACANVCPPRCIVVSDPSQEKRVVEFFLERCTYCGRCQEVCPEKAIVLTPEFETATDSRRDLYQSVELFMGTCQRCGRCFQPSTKVDRMMVTGFREPPGHQAR